jgi:hypothetical protein
VRNSTNEAAQVVGQSPVRNDQGMKNKTLAELYHYLISKHSSFSAFDFWQLSRVFLVRGSKEIFQVGCRLIIPQFKAHLSAKYSIACELAI